MDNKKIAGLLNPIRMKIIQVFLKEETATKKVIATELPSVPPASLYRHLRKLVEEEILEIIQENKIRGTIEKVYKLKLNPFEELEQYGDNATDEQMNQLYYVFSMTNMSQFMKYIGKDNKNFIDDRIGFRTYPMYMSTQECDEFFQDFGKLLMKYAKNKPEKGRRLRNFSFTFLPSDTGEIE